MSPIFSLQEALLELRLACPAPDETRSKAIEDNNKEDTESSSKDGP